MKNNEIELWLRQAAEAEAMPADYRAGEYSEEPSEQ